MELEWNEIQFWDQEWDGLKDHFGIGMESKTVLESGVGWIQRQFWNWNGIKDSFGIRSRMDSKTVLELEWNQTQFWNQQWDGFKDCFGIGMESILLLNTSAVILVTHYLKSGTRTRSPT